MEKKFCEKHQIEYESKQICVFQGMPIFENCPKCEEERKIRREKEEKEAKQAEQKAIKNAFENRLRSAGVSERYIVEGFKETEFSKRYEKYLELEDGDFKLKNNLIFLGGCGIGKSFFCYRMVELAQKNKLNYDFIKARELRDTFKQSKEGSNYRFNSVDNVEKLVKGLDGIVIDEIDDIFGELEAFKFLISLCYDKMIRIIIIGNCTMEDFKRRVEAKTYSRLAGAKVISGQFKDLRIQE